MAGTIADIRNEKLGSTVVKALESRNFEAYYCAGKEEALEQVLKLVPEGSSVSWGGSMSLDELGVKEKLRQGNFALIDRDAVEPKEIVETMRKALTCDVYLTSTNALSEDGQLVNVDGNGNRVAAMAFGPKSVIVIAGVNKIVKSEEDAVARARNIAAPLNAQRFENMETPCKKTGCCGDCKAKGCICSTLVTTRMCLPVKRIKVIVVGENLGF